MVLGQMLNQEYWHLVLAGELENHLAFVQEGTEKCLRNYLDIFHGSVSDF